MLVLITYDVNTEDAAGRKRLREGVPELMSLAETMKIGIIVGGMVLGGILISLCFTFFAVNKFVNMKSNKIYLY